MKTVSFVITMSRLFLKDRTPINETLHHEYTCSLNEMLRELQD